LEEDMNIFVGNISFNTTEDAIRGLFETHGQVDSVRIITDRETGRSRGFGFVEMADDEQAKAAIAAVDGADLDGRTIKVNEAKPREDRGGGGGGRRPSGGGGGGGGRRSW
jgi:cold-inducible RNA-binding protein